jgi:hypothetical protein
MAYLRRLSMLLAFSVPYTLAPGCASDLSSKGQLIECSVGPNGAISSCKPTTQTETNDPSKCIDVDEDGDDDPDDEADDVDDDELRALVGRPDGNDDDDDDDGTPDEMDDDDDDDGVPDDDDCDEEQGGEDDEPDDDDSADDDL